MVRALALFLFASVLVSTQPAMADHVREGDVRFKVTCNWDHSASDDPIVFPNRPGAAHLHDFFGAENVTAYSNTFAELLALPTNCNDGEDHAAYWSPAVYTAQGKVAVTRFTAYYRRGNKHGTIRPFPNGLKIVADAGAGIASGFQCNSSPPSPTPMDCGSDLVKMSVDFPDCWDGVHKDSADHRSHMAYSYHQGDANVCPPSHPVQVPRIEIFISLDLTDGTLITGLSSGPVETLHADFFNGWVRTRLRERINTCLNQFQRCDSGG